MDRMTKGSIGNAGKEQKKNGNNRKKERQKNKEL